MCQFISVMKQVLVSSSVHCLNCDLLLLQLGLGLGLGLGLVVRVSGEGV